jgi:hypothetical protein
MLTSAEALSEIKNLTDIDHVRMAVTPGVTHVSLSYDNPDAKKIMVWAGTSHWPESIASDEVNADGGALGGPIKLVVQDDKDRPKAVVEAADLLSDLEKAPLAMDPLPRAETPEGGARPPG